LGNNAASHVILNIFTVQWGVPIMSDHDDIPFIKVSAWFLVNHSLNTRGVPNALLPISADAPFVMPRKGSHAKSKV